MRAPLASEVSCTLNACGEERITIATTLEALSFADFGTAVPFALEVCTSASMQFRETCISSLVDVVSKGSLFFGMCQAGRASTCCSVGHASAVAALFFIERVFA